MTAKATPTKPTVKETPATVDPVDIDTQRVIEALQSNGVDIPPHYITEGSIGKAIPHLQKAGFIEPLLNLINSPQVIRKTGIVSNLKQIGLSGFTGGFFGELQLASNYLQAIITSSDKQTVVQVGAMPAVELAETLKALGFNQAAEIIQKQKILENSLIGGDLTLWKMAGDQDLAEFIQFKAVDREENIKANVKAAQNQLLGTGQDGIAGLWNAEQTIPHPNFKGVIHVQLKENTPNLATNAESHRRTAFEGTKTSVSQEGGTTKYVHELRFTNISGDQIGTISNPTAEEKTPLIIGNKQGKREVQAVKEATYLQIRRLGIKAIQRQSQLEKQRLIDEAAAAKQFQQREFEKQLERRGSVDLSQYKITDDVRKVFNDLIALENQEKKPLSGERFLTDILDNIRGLVARSKNKPEDVDAWVNAQISAALQTVGKKIIATFETKNQGLTIENLEGDSITDYIEENDLENIPNQLQGEVEKVKQPKKVELEGFSKLKRQKSNQSINKGKKGAKKGQKNRRTKKP